MKVDPLSHVAARFVNALQMVTQLISFVDDPRLPFAVRLACVEDWYINYRLLIEFLFGKPPSNCASPQNFLTGWKSTSSSRSDLLADYGRASEDFAHIGNLKGRQTPEVVTPSDLLPKAIAIVAIAEEFSKALTAEDHELADMIRIGVEKARAALVRMAPSST